jgi:hypothetical protein
MSTIILKAGNFAKIGSIVLQAITLVVSIAETVSKPKESSRQAAGDQHDPAEGE